MLLSCRNRFGLCVKKNCDWDASRIKFFEHITREHQVCRRGPHPRTFGTTKLSTQCYAKFPQHRSTCSPNFWVTKIGINRPRAQEGAGCKSTEVAATTIRSPSAFLEIHDIDQGLGPLQNVHAREFKLRLGFSSYDEQVTRNWHRQ